MSRIPYLIVVFRVVLAVVVVGLGAAFVSKSEPAASSPDEVAVAAPPSAPTPVPFVPPVSQRPPHGTPVDYTICTSNGSWTKPPAEIEAGYLATSAVHATFDDIAAQFRAPFWRDAGNEGAFSALTELTGLWTASNGGLDVQAMVQAGCAASPASRRGLINLWALGYIVDDVRTEDGRILVYTEPRRGFQTIQIRSPVPKTPRSCPLTS